MLINVTSNVVTKAISKIRFTPLNVFIFHVAKIKFGKCTIEL